MFEKVDELAADLARQVDKEDDDQKVVKVDVG